MAPKKSAEEKFQVMTVTLPADVKLSLFERVAEGTRSAFIAQAIAEKLRKVGKAEEK